MLHKAAPKVILNAQEAAGQMSRTGIRKVNPQRSVNTQCYKANADLKTQCMVFKEGDRVLLSTKNLRTCAQGANKLLPRFVGPFLVTACFGNQAYEVELPASMRIHNVFHVSLLKPYRESGAYQPPSLHSCSSMVMCSLMLLRLLRYDPMEAKCKSTLSGGLVMVLNMTLGRPEDCSCELQGQASAVSGMPEE